MTYNSLESVMTMRIIIQRVLILYADCALIRIVTMFSISCIIIIIATLLYRLQYKLKRAFQYDCNQKQQISIVPL